MHKFQNNKVLVVDDEEFCISAMKGMLFKAGLDIEFQVDFCIDGKQAVELVKQMYNCGFNYKLIISDFNMPEMNGIEATKNIRKFL